MFTSPLPSMVAPLIVHTRSQVASRTPVIVVDDDVKHDIHQMVNLIKTLPLNFMSNVGGGRGCRCGYYQ